MLASSFTSMDWHPASRHTTSAARTALEVEDVVLQIETVLRAAREREPGAIGKRDHEVKASRDMSVKYLITERPDVGPRSNAARRKHGAGWTRFIVLVMLVAASCSSRVTFAQARDWAFVQSVGGLAVEQPFRQDGRWFLPVRCDVSGIQAVTAKPSVLNSGIGCSTVARVEGRAILLRVETRLVSPAKCPPVDLGASLNGRYTVFYASSPKERVKISEVNIAP